MNLDDAAALKAADPGGMLDAIAALPRDCRAAYDAARARTDLPPAGGVTSVVFCGMGGSAVAGDLLRAVYRDRLTVPVEVNRSPQLPAHAGATTLVAVCTYSGNTAETLASFAQARARGCRVVVVTSGGRAKELAEAGGIPVVIVPGGAQPRAALGHLGSAWLGALEAMGLLPGLGGDVDEAVAELTDLVAELGPEVPAAENAAKRLAGAIGDRSPVVWGAEGIAAVAAMRWKTQMNENGKIPAFSAAMSELDHNEVVGWTRPFGERFAVIALRHDGEDPSISPRFPLSADIARSAGAIVEEVHASGRSSLARLLSLIIVGDFASVYVALRRGVDPTPVTVIEHLKAALAGEAG